MKHIKLRPPPGYLLIVLSCTTGVVAACTATQDLGNTATLNPERDGAVSVDSDGRVSEIQDGGRDAEDSVKPDAMSAVDADSAPADGAAAADAATLPDAGPAPDVRLLASNAGPDDAFGAAVAMSQDGLWLAVGAPGESSAATGINGFEGDNSATNAGAVYIYLRTGGTWVKQAYVKASNTRTELRFGRAIAMSTAGDVLVVGGAPASTNRDSEVYVFRRGGTVWTQEALIGRPYPEFSPAPSRFGAAVAIDSAGATIVLGEPGANCTRPTDAFREHQGCAHVYTRSVGSWVLSADLAPSRRPGSPTHSFAQSLSVSGNGLTIAVGDENDGGVSTHGSVHLFVKSSAGGWPATGIVSGSAPSGQMGSSVALNAPGTLLLAGTPGLAGSGTTPGTSVTYTASATSWSIAGTHFSPSGAAQDGFGLALALSGDAQWFAMGSRGTAANKGNKLQLFRQSGAPGGFVADRLFMRASNTHNDHFGEAVATDETGQLWAVGAPSEKSIWATTGTLVESGAVHIVTR